MDIILIIGLGNIGEKYRFTRHNIGFMCVDRILEMVGLQDDFHKRMAGGLTDIKNNKKQDSKKLVFDKNLSCFKIIIPLRDFLAPLGNNIDALKEILKNRIWGRKDSKNINIFQDYRDFKNYEDSKDSQNIATQNLITKDSQNTKESRNQYNQNLISESFCKILNTIDSQTQVFLCLPTTFMNHSGEAIAKITKHYNVIATIVVFDDIDTRFGSVNARVKGEKSGNGGHNGIKSIDHHFHKNYVKIKLGIGANVFFSNTHNWMSSVCASEKNGIKNNINTQDKQNNIVMFEIISECFKQTLSEKLHFSPAFKTKSFNQILLSKILENTQKYPHIESFFKTLNINKLHKTYNKDVVSYVLSNFLREESYELDNILEYTSYVIFIAIFELMSKTRGLIGSRDLCYKQKSLESLSPYLNLLALDRFNIKF